MKKSILIILSALLCFSACLKDELREDKVQINIRAISELSDLKSSIPAKELAIRDMNVYAYSGGKLYAEAYSSGSSLKLLLDKAKQYNLYVLANVGKQDAPWKEGDLADVGCTFVYQAEGFRIVEDVKGKRTKEYVLKRKLFRSLYCLNSGTIFVET